MQTMYSGLVNSPETTITNNISNSDTIIYVLDPSRVPADLPNLMTLGTGTNAETVKVTEVDGNALTVERGFQGTLAAWPAGTVIARNFTEYDYNALKENIAELNTGKEALIKNATAKTTPVDADTMPLSDSAASGATKKITWANIKTALKTYFDTLYVALTRVANNLTTDEDGYVLDARQGKALADLISNNIARKNILHNWDFRNPVNQRNSSSYVTTSGYCIDRWLIQSGGGNATFTINPGYCTLVGVPTGSLIRQYLEFPTLYCGKTLTISVDIDGVIYSGYGNIPTSLPANPTTFFTVPFPNGEAVMRGYTGYLYITITTYATMNIYRAKVELGSVSTLVNDPPADYGEQLILCQRYFERIGTTNSEILGSGVCTSSTTAEVMVKCNVKKRIASPTITVPDVSQFRLRIGGEAQACTGLTFSSSDGTNIIAFVTVASVTAGQACILKRADSATSSYIDVSADL